MRRALAAVCVLGVCGCAHSPARGPAENRAPGEPSDVQRFEALDPGHVYRGSHPNGPADFAFLEELKIRSIVSLQTLPTDTGPERRAAESAAPPIRFLNAPFAALPIAPSSKEVNAAEDEIGDPANQPAYFHCKLGRDRTGLVAALYRVYYQGWNPSDAHAEWRRYGFTDPVFFSGLEHYFDHHADPLPYWKCNPELTALTDWDASSCAGFRNAKGGADVLCRVEGNLLTAPTVLHALGRAEGAAAINALAAGGDCARSGGQVEDLHGDRGVIVDVCRYGDGSAVELGAFNAPERVKALESRLASWRMRGGTPTESSVQARDKCERGH